MKPIVNSKTYRAYIREQKKILAEKISQIRQQNNMSLSRIAKAENFSKWKRVDEDFPPFCEWVLVYDGADYEVLKCELSNNDDRYAWVDKDEEHRKIIGDHCWCYIDAPEIYRHGSQNLRDAVYDEYDRLHDERTDRIADDDN